MFRQLIKFGIKLSAPAIKSTVSVPRTFPSVVVLDRKSMATYKTSTGLVGLNVDPNGRETMQAICRDVLTNVQVLNHSNMKYIWTD